MKQEIRDRWTAALRSGEYEQGRAQLRDDEGRYCCLGVLCDVVGFDLDSTVRDPRTVYDGGPWAEAPGVLIAPPLLAAMTDETTRGLLANQNDSGRTFAQIADWIDAHVELEP